MSKEPHSTTILSETRHSVQSHVTYRLKHIIEQNINQKNAVFLWVQVVNFDDEKEEQVKDTQISSSLANNKPNETGANRKVPAVTDVENEPAAIQRAPSIPGPPSSSSTTNYSSVDNEIWYVYSKSNLHRR